MSELDLFRLRGVANLERARSPLRASLCYYYTLEGLGWRNGNGIRLSSVVGRVIPFYKRYHVRETKRKLLLVYFHWARGLDLILPKTPGHGCCIILPFTKPSQLPHPRPR